MPKYISAVNQASSLSHSSAQSLTLDSFSGALASISDSDILGRTEHRSRALSTTERADYRIGSVETDNGQAPKYSPSPMADQTDTPLTAGARQTGTAGPTSFAATFDLRAEVAAVLETTAPTIRVSVGTTAAQLQHLIDTASAGTTLKLEAGHYQFDRTIVIDRDDITVTGSGSANTFIDVPSSLGEAAFQIGSGRMSGDFSLAGNIAEGGKVMTLTGGHSFIAGDYVYLSRDSTNSFYDEIGDTTWRNTDVALRTSIVQVAAVNGSTITLASGVHFDFTTSESHIREISMAEGVTLGGFTVDYGLTTANPAAFTNTLANFDRNAVIEVDGTAGLSLFDITSHDVPSLGVNVASSTGVMADGLKMTGAHNKGDGGNGYGLQIRDVYDSRFVNLSDADMRHSVVFASWTSAVGNFVHVAQTDRDINFHGGRDHDNVVIVDRSIRDANSDIISPTLFVNTEGTHYGTVTEAGANTVTFGKVIGSRLNDTVTGYDTGAWLDGMRGDDSLTGGAGNDVLIGGAGRDVLRGAAGEDIAQYTGKYADFTITNTGNSVFQIQDRVGIQSTDLVAEVEWLLFNDTALRLTDMSAHPVSALDALFAGMGPPPPITLHPAVTPPPPPVLVGTSGNDLFQVTQTGTTVKGLGGFDTVQSTVNFTMSDDTERLDLVGTAAINGTGGVNADYLYGNAANNILHGMAGLDQLWGRDGNDVLLGGSGNDLLYGDAGNDRIDGGAGQDKMKGGAGADVFVFSLASDTDRRYSDKVQDFQTGIDKIDLTGIDADTAIAGNQAFVWGVSASGAASLWVKSGYVFGDTNNDGVADLAIYVTGSVVQQDILL